MYTLLFFFLNCCFNESSEVEGCGKMGLQSLISRVLAGRYLFEICHENPILNLSLGPCVCVCVCVCVMTPFLTGYPKFQQLFCGFKIF